MAHLHQPRVIRGRQQVESIQGLDFFHHFQAEVLWEHGINPSLKVPGRMQLTS